MDQSPLFARAYDLLRESCLQSERMPRSRRAVLGRRMEDAAFDFHEAITAAARSRDPRPLLAQADIALNRWRLCLRLGADLALFSEGRHAELMQLVAESGRLLGGWQRKLAPRV
jgi:siroheme synthase (precorrin-2 oxidase/ferrochelatase)